MKQLGNPLHLVVGSIATVSVIKISAQMHRESSPLDFLAAVMFAMIAFLAITLWVRSTFDED